MYFSFSFLRLMIYSYRGRSNRVYTNYTKDAFLGKGRKFRVSLALFKTYIIDINIMEKEV